MNLSFEVSPSEAGIVVDGLHAQGFDAEPVRQPLGSVTSVVTITALSDTDAAEVRDIMLVLATNAREVSTD